MNMTLEMEENGYTKSEVLKRDVQVLMGMFLRETFRYTLWRPLRETLRYFSEVLKRDVKVLLGRPFSRSGTLKRCLREAFR